MKVEAKNWKLPAKSRKLGEENRKQKYAYRMLDLRYEKPGILKEKSAVQIDAAGYCDEERFGQV